MDELDASASLWGAVNTIRFEGRDEEGEWRRLSDFDAAGWERPVAWRTQGFNTDADAISRSLQEDLGLTLRGARVFLLGAGGAARAIA